MHEKKTIQINPDLFRMSEKNTSRKKTSTPKIKIKSTEKKQKQKTLRKNVLKMIREKQQEEYKRLFNTSEPKKTTTSTGASEKEFNKDFDASLEFFSSLATKPENVIQNATFKRYPEMSSVVMQPNAPIFINTNENVNMELPEEFNIVATDSMYMKPQRMPLPPPPPPKYGCLKNGILPTYRQGMRIQYPGPNIMVTPKQESIPITSSFSSLEQRNKNTPGEIVQKYNKVQNMFSDKSKNRIKYQKRKKIYKRTYCIGRSTTKPQIGVLVSNRTIRNRIATDAQLLKQTPIHDVRKFLIKKGFIKVGTNAPNDVLRKMYESVSLVCGEIQNHNPENLLFNFIHDTV